MARLRQMLTDLGCTAVKTYIQSGNVVMDSTLTDHQLASSLTDTIGREFGFWPPVLTLSRARLQRVMAQNPWPEMVTEPAKLHVWFFSDPAAKVDAALLESLLAADEKVEVRPPAIYLWAPSGIGRSKLAARMDEVVDCPVTARNWRTLSKITELA